MLKIIITGGIATGKSVVSSYLKGKSYTVIDADIVARQVVEVGQPGLLALEKAFGNDFINSDGTLNRKSLGEIIFNDDQARLKVNGILHPIIFKAIEKQVTEFEKQGLPLVFLDIPLFYEGESTYSYDEVWLVYTDEETQIQRLMKRNQLTKEQAKARIDSQLSIEAKKAFDNVIIDNRGSLEDTYQQVDAALSRLNLAL